MKISDSNNIKDTISDAETICIINDYERHLRFNGKDLDTMLMQQMRVISVYVECMYLKKREECPQCGTHKKKLKYCIWTNRNTTQVILTFCCSGTTLTKRHKRNMR